MSYSHLQYESSLYYALVLGNFVISPTFCRNVNYFFIHAQKSTFSKFKADFCYNLALNITIKPLLKLS